MCLIRVSRYACGCEHRESEDCKKFEKQKKKGLSFWQTLLHARFMACSKTEYKISSKATYCLKRNCPKRNRDPSKVPVVMRDTARGTTGFLYKDPESIDPAVRRRVPAPAPAPIHHKERANARDQMKHSRTKVRGHEAPQLDKCLPPLPLQPSRGERREDKARDLKRTNGQRLPEKHEGTHADPRRRHGDRMAQKIEAPKLGNVEARREGPKISKPVHRVASTHGVLECATPPRAHRSDRHHVQEPARPRQRVVDSWRPPSNVPARPRAPVHEYHRQRRYHPISRDVSPARRRDSPTRIPEPLNIKKQRPAAPPTNQRPPPQVRRTAAPAPAPRDIPNPMFAKKQRQTVLAPKDKKKKSFMSKIGKALGLEQDNDSDLSFCCRGLDPGQPPPPRRRNGKFYGAFRSDHLEMMPEPRLTYRT